MSHLVKGRSSSLSYARLSAQCNACQNNVTSIIIYCRALNDLVLGSLAWILIVRLVSNSMDIVRDNPLLHCITFYVEGNLVIKGTGEDMWRGERIVIL